MVSEKNGEMKYYIIAGEASGDLHGSNLIKALKNYDNSAKFRGFGGDKMEKVGLHLLKHYKELAFMGFVEVVANLKTILNNFKLVKDDILTFQPDVLILIDYPGFNMRMAKWAHQQGIKVHYYIAPQIWAWNTKRVHAIKSFVDKTYVILPFEKDFFQKYDYSADFVGHPLLDFTENYIVSTDFKSKNPLGEKPLIALLPGSRSQEIHTSLPIMLKMVDRFPDYQFCIAQAPSMPDSIYKKYIQDRNVVLINNQTYDLLASAKGAIVTSGTATLETALFNVPQVVVYQGSFISYHIAKQLIKVDYISLVNLIMNEEVVTELIQKDFNSKRLEKELFAILGNQRSQILENYQILKTKLGDVGAANRTAQLIYNSL